MNKLVKLDNISFYDYDIELIEITEKNFKSLFGKYLYETDKLARICFHCLTNKESPYFDSFVIFPLKQNSSGYVDRSIYVTFAYLKNNITFEVCFASQHITDMERLKEISQICDAFVNFDKQKFIDAVEKTKKEMETLIMNREFMKC